MSHRCRAFTVPVIVVGACAVFSASALATTFTPNRLDDPVSGGGNCTPPAPANGCSLRGAIAAATSGTDTVALPAGTFVLGQGALTIGHALTITGAGAGSTTIEQTAHDRLINSTAPSLALTALRLTGGNVIGTSPGPSASGVVGGDGQAESGSAISYTGALSLSDTMVDHNTVTGGTGGTGGATAAGGQGGNADGAIVGTGALTVTRSTFLADVAHGGDGGTGGVASGPGTGGKGGQAGNALGGAISITGPMTVTSSLFAANVALPGNGGTGGAGSGTSGSMGGEGGGFNAGDGGALVISGATADLTNDTFTANISGGSAGGTGGTGGPNAAGGAGGAGEGSSGGAIAILFGATVRLDSDTIAGNTAGVVSPAPGGGGGKGGGPVGAPGTVLGSSGDDITLGPSTLELRNTIIAGGGGQPPVGANPAATNCLEAQFGGTLPTVITDGHNLDDGASCIPAPGPGDAVNTPAGLTPLADNGGPTKTMALLAGSAAIHGVAGACVQVDGTTQLTTDQRDMPRGNPCDIGAFEGQAPTVGPPGAFSTVANSSAPFPVLTCTAGTITGDLPSVVTYSWRSNGVVVAGQTASTYATDQTVNGTSVACVVTSTNAYGTASTPSEAVVVRDDDSGHGGPPPPPPVVRPKLTAFSVVGPGNHAPRVHHPAEITYTLNTAARVTFKLWLKRRGVKAGSGCVIGARLRPGHRSRPCTLLLRVYPAPPRESGGRGRQGHRWTPAAALRAGDYQLWATPKNSEAGPTAKANFTMLAH